MTEQDAIYLRDAMTFALEIMNKSKSKDKRLPTSKKVIRQFVEELNGELMVVPRVFSGGTLH